MQETTKEKKKNEDSRTTKSRRSNKTPPSDSFHSSLLPAMSRVACAMSGASPAALRTSRAAAAAVAGAVRFFVSLPISYYRRRVCARFAERIRATLLLHSLGFASSECRRDAIYAVTGKELQAKPRNCQKEAARLDRRRKRRRSKTDKAADYHRFLSSFFRTLPPFPSLLL